MSVNLLPRIPFGLPPAPPPPPPPGNSGGIGSAGINGSGVISGRGRGGCGSGVTVLSGVIFVSGTIFISGLISVYGTIFAVVSILVVIPVNGVYSVIPCVRGVISVIPFEKISDVISYRDSGRVTAVDSDRILDTAVESAIALASARDAVDAVERAVAPAVDKEMPLENSLLADIPDGDDLEFATPYDSPLTPDSPCDSELDPADIPTSGFATVANDPPPTVSTPV